MGKKKRNQEATTLAFRDVSNSNRVENAAAHGGSPTQDTSPSLDSSGLVLLAEKAGANGKRKVSNGRLRFMDKTGKCNIRKNGENMREKYLRDIFYTVVDMTGCLSGMGLFCVTYLAAWSVFGFFWWLLAYLRGDVARHYEHLHLHKNLTANASDKEACVENVYSYTTAFLFLVETETTVGYGFRAITDRCPEAVILFVLQALAASILDAFMIGALFLKISRPTNRAETLIFSDHCAIAKRDGKYCLMFRVGNMRSSLIVQCRIRAKYVSSHKTAEGVDLHQSDINVGFDTGADNLFLVTPLVISHEINEKSPFWSMSANDLQERPFEIIAILEGMVESTGMICQAYTSYLNTEVLWGHRFGPILSQASGHFRVDFVDFNQTYEVNLERYSSEEYEQNKKLGKTSSSNEVAIPEKVAAFLSITAGADGGHKLQRKTPLQRRRHLRSQHINGDWKSSQPSSSSSVVMPRKSGENEGDPAFRPRRCSCDAIHDQWGRCDSGDSVAGLLSVHTPNLRRHSHVVTTSAITEVGKIRGFGSGRTTSQLQTSRDDEVEELKQKSIAERSSSMSERRKDLFENNLVPARTLYPKNVTTAVAIVSQDGDSSIGADSSQRCQMDTDDETKQCKIDVDDDDTSAVFFIETDNVV